MRFIEESDYQLIRQRYMDVLTTLTRARDEGMNASLIDYLEGQKDVFELFMYDVGMKKTSEYTAIHVRAKNDVNGNPRRAYVVLDNRQSTVKDIIDIGYRGSSVLDNIALDETESVNELWKSFNIDVKDYKKLLKDKHFIIG